jgi:hypothetical protein
MNAGSSKLPHSSPKIHEAPAEFSHQWEYSFLPEGLSAAVRVADALIQEKSGWEDRLHARFYAIIVLFVLLTCPVSWYFLVQLEAPHSVVSLLLGSACLICFVALVKLRIGESDLPSIGFVAWGLLAFMTIMITISGGLTSGAVAFFAPLTLMATGCLERNSTGKILRAIKLAILAIAGVSLFSHYIPQLMANDKALTIVAYDSVIATFAMLLFAYIHLANVTLRGLRQRLNQGFDAETGCLDISIFKYLRGIPRFSDVSSVLEFSFKTEEGLGLSPGERRALVIEIEKYLKNGSLYFYDGGHKLLAIIPLEGRHQLERIVDLLMQRLSHSQALPVVCNILSSSRNVMLKQ